MSRINYLDVSGLWKEFNELLDDQRGLVEEVNDADYQDKLAACKELAEWHDENGERLQELRDLFDELGHANEWRDNDPFVDEDSFLAYAEYVAESIGAIDDDTSWPFCHIDWEAAADALKMDYSSVEFEGTTYWYRS